MSSIASIRTVRLLDREPGKEAEEKRIGDVLIERGIPVPTPHQKRGLKAVLLSMEVGESFLWPKRVGGESFASVAPRTFTLKRQPTGVYRIWRTK